MIDEPVVNLLPNDYACDLSRDRGPYEFRYGINFFKECSAVVTENELAGLLIMIELARKCSQCVTEGGSRNGGFAKSR